jgi:hypothetical protein
MIKTISYQICDGCCRFNLGNGLEAARTVFIKDGQEVAPETVDAKRVDLCVICDNSGLLICVRCEKVHLHESDCEFWLGEVVNFELPKAA